MKEYIVKVHDENTTAALDKAGNRELVRCGNCTCWRRYDDVRTVGYCRVVEYSKHENGFCDNGEKRSEE